MSAARHVVHFVPSHPDTTGVAAVIDALLEVSAATGGTDEVLTYFGQRAPVVGRRRRFVRRTLSRVPWAVLLRHDEVAHAITRLPPASVLVCHGVFTPACARVAAIARRRRPDIAVVAFPHDPYDAGLFGNRRLLKQAYWRLVERPYLRRVARVVVTAPSHAAHLRGRGVQTPVALVRLGLSQRRMRQLTAIATRRSARPPRLLVLGRWDLYEKGLDLFCHALGQVSPDAPVRFVGPPCAGAEALAEHIRRAGLTRAEALGYVDDVLEQLTWADAVCMTSRKEGFGLAALEAMSAGRPLLLSRAAGLAEILASDTLAHRSTGAASDAVDASVVLVEASEPSVAHGLGLLLAGCVSGELSDAAAVVRETVQHDFVADRTYAQLHAAVRAL